MSTSNFQEKTNFIWELANLLRGSYRKYEYQDIILPLTVLKRLDDVLAPTKQQVLERKEELKKRDIKPGAQSDLLENTAGYPFYNTSEYTFESLVDDSAHIVRNLRDYINGFSQNARDIIYKFDFDDEIQELADKNLLFQLIQKFNEIDLHPDTVPNHEMGTIFEELIRKFAEQSNETAGEHFTPRQIIRLMAQLVIVGNGDIEKQNIIRKIYDPACGTGGMLTIARNEIKKRNPSADVFLYGQELNDKTYAIAKADMLIKGEPAENIKSGNSFTQDKLSTKNDTFDYMITNPPFGVSWSNVRDFIDDEAERGSSGRFEAGTPRVSDGQLLFLQHMISKMKKREDGGSRIATVFNGSPLFTGDAGSGESEIRRWLIENDWLETIIALPDELFYNTGINTYIWILSNNKHEDRRGQVQLIDAREMYEKMQKSLGDKRNRITDEHIQQIIDMYKANDEMTPASKVFDTDHFGFRKIRVERPLQRNFQASDERIERLDAEKLFRKLAETDAEDPEEKEVEIEAGQKKQQQIKDVLEGMDDRLYKNQPQFEDDLEVAFEDSQTELTSNLKKAIISALSERDESADIVEKSNSDPKPDTDLRDYERVPLGTDPEEYFEKEVKPHVPNAWISDSRTYIDDKDGELGRVGYEISFTRYFYEYKPPRELAEIKSDISQLKQDTEGLMGELFE